MADIRIKDLTTTASSTASDDFIAVDGTTNGTRKLNAFSPTFGGNATVTGTLTVNGTGNSVFGGKVRWGNTAYPGYNAYLSEASTDSQLYPAIARNLVGSTGTGYTIANGELGAYCGFEFRVGDIRWFGATGTFTTGQTVTPVESMRLVSAGNLLIGTTTDNGQKLQVNGTATVLATTASTTTSSGALVVGNGTSGGLGVGGAITAGGTLRVVGSSQIIRVRHDASNIEFTNTAQDAYVTGTVIGNTLQLHGNNGTGLTIGTTGNATFAGNITTAAPSGGTAAAWKLGTVASVSPTSPNRTIEVDIGGTIYYIHAKTTNN